MPDSSPTAISQPPLPVVSADASGPSPLAMSVRGRVRAFAELAKLRLNTLVVVTTLVGFLIVDAPWDWPLLVFTAVGTALAAGGSAAFNCLIEIDRDRAMRRTKKRPLPSGQLSRASALIFAVCCSVGGVGLLAIEVNLLTAGLAALVVVLYAAIYTPMKTKSTINTLIGGICGAIPPMMGVTAITNEITPAAWAIGAILFVWQIPHFLALAWMYREDYKRGGFKMLPALDPTGELTARQILIYATALIPLSLSATLTGIGGVVYAIGSVLLGVWLLRPAILFYRERSPRRARRLFFTTLGYLPLLLALMLIDRGPLFSPGWQGGDNGIGPSPRAATHSGDSPASLATVPAVVETSINSESRW